MHFYTPHCLECLLCFLFLVSFLAFILRKCRTVRFQSSLHGLRQTLFVCSVSIYILLDYFFFCLAALPALTISSSSFTGITSTWLWNRDHLILTSHILILLFLNFYWLFLTYILQHRSATVLARFSESMGSRGFTGADHEAVHRSSIQMDRRLPAFPKALLHRCWFHILWSWEFLCCNTKTTLRYISGAYIFLKEFFI